MEDKILVNLSTDANHTFESAHSVIGRVGEGGTTQFEITIPDKLIGCSVYLDFEKPNGEKIRTPRLGIENGKLIYDVVQYLLTDYGEIKVQAVLIAEDGKTWKSSKKKYHIKKSINAIEDIPDKEDFMSELQKILDECGDLKDVNNRLSAIEELGVGDMKARLAVLEQWKSDKDYTKITASLYVNPSTAEVGSSVENAKLTWSISKATKSVELLLPAKANEASGETVKVNGLTSYIDTNAYKQNTVAGVGWTLTAKEADRDGVATARAILTFLNGVYYGVSNNSAIKASNKDAILALTKDLRNMKLTNFSVNAEEGQYIYYCLPKRLGACSFKVGGFDGGFSLVDEGSFENASGYSEIYYIYRSDNASLGSTSVSVS